MRTFRLEDFNLEMMDEFIKFSNDYWDTPWCIFIRSSGGEIWIQEEINTIIDRKIVSHGEASVVIYVSMAYSAAFHFLLQTTAPVVILTGARGMIHLSAMYMEITSNGKPYTEAGNYIKMINTERKSLHKDAKVLMEQILTPAEFQMYTNAEDVYFEYNRLKKIFK